MRRHKAILVRWEDEEAWIDEELAPLILELWKAGIGTVNSCQENRPGWVWIEFYDTSHAVAFINIVARYEEGIQTFYNRIRQAWVPREGELEEAWEYSVHPIDMAVYDISVDDRYIEESCSGPSAFIFSLSIRFPRPDLPLILKRVRQHNKQVRLRERID